MKFHVLKTIWISQFQIFASNISKAWGKFRSVFGVKNVIFSSSFYPFYPSNPIQTTTRILKTLCFVFLGSEFRGSVRLCIPTDAQNDINLCRICRKVANECFLFLTKYLFYWIFLEKKLTISFQILEVNFRCILCQC